MLGVLKVIAATALVFVLWLVITGTSILPSAPSKDPPRPPAPIPAPTTATPTAQATAGDIAKLNDTIAKLTAAVDRLNKQLAEPASKPSGSSSRPDTDAPRRQEIDARPTWKRSSWRDPPCWRC